MGYDHIRKRLAELGEILFDRDPNLPGNRMEEAREWYQGFTTEIDTDEAARS